MPSSVRHVWTVALFWHILLQRSIISIRVRMMARISRDAARLNVSRHDEFSIGCEPSERSRWFIGPWAPACQLAFTRAFAMPGWRTVISADLTSANALASGAMVVAHRGLAPRILLVLEILLVFAPVACFRRMVTESVISSCISFNLMESSNTV